MAKKISVIIPVHNDPKGLRETLQSIIKQSFPPSTFEVVVVDNGSTDETTAVAGEFARKYPEIVTSIEENRTLSSYAARNAGIRISTGETLSFIDADMTVQKDWLQKIEQTFSTSNPDYLGCDVEITATAGTIAELFDKATGFPVEKYLKNSGFAPTCCLTVKRTVFDSAGFFDSRLQSGGDMEFGNRVKDKGFLLAFEPTIKMQHPARTSIHALLKKHFRVGKGLRQLWTFYPARYPAFRPSSFIPRHILPPRPWKIKANTTPGLSRSTFWLVFWMTELAKLSGYITETIRNHS